MNNYSPPLTISHFDNVYNMGPEIGRGGYGIVYECTDAWQNDLVAKQIIPLSGDTQETVYARWMDESKKLILMRHPNITFLHDAFFCDGHFYLIIEKCDLTLWQILNNPKISTPQLLYPVARCILQAADFMHKNGYVHKDLHPGNVFATFIKDELHPGNKNAVTFKVGDLGISRLMNEVNAFNTLLAPWMLPPEYISPEKFGKIGSGTDIYHTGLILLGLLASSPLMFTNDQILSGYPMNFSANNFGLEGQVIARALEPEMSKRYPSALEFWKELKSLI
ncbi:MAG: protein kinase [Deltaproteobacteria bacterium]|nr:protein kinase [Deltaproteobacteria bacterium]